MIESSTGRLVAAAAQLLMAVEKLYCTRFDQVLAKLFTDAQEHSRRVLAWSQLEGVLRDTTLALADALDALEPGTGVAARTALATAEAAELREQAQALQEQLAVRADELAEALRMVYKKAKAENDDRFMRERDEVRDQLAKEKALHKLASFVVSSQTAEINEVKVRAREQEERAEMAEAAAAVTRKWVIEKSQHTSECTVIIDRYTDHPVDIKCHCGRNEILADNAGAQFLARLRAAEQERDQMRERCGKLETALKEIAFDTEPTELACDIASTALDDLAGDAKEGKYPQHLTGEAREIELAAGLKAAQHRATNQDGVGTCTDATHKEGQ